VATYSQGFDSPVEPLFEYRCKEIQKALCQLVKHSEAFGNISIPHLGFLEKYRREKN